MPKKVYAVRVGRSCGLFTSWADCEKQVAGFPGARYKSFATAQEALAWLAGSDAPHAERRPARPSARLARPRPKAAALALPLRPDEAQDFVIYTDGSCLVNPNGPGGFAAVFLTPEGRELLTLSGGEPSSTNNRMELRAAYEALKLLDDGIRRTITFHTDSKYLQKAITNRWLYNWKRNGWLTAAKTPVLNQDLWKALDRVMTPHHLTFEWVKGHVGTKYNEMCDTLAKGEAMKFKKW